MLSNVTFGTKVKIKGDSNIYYAGPSTGDSVSIYYDKKCEKYYKWENKVKLTKLFSEAEPERSAIAEKCLFLLAANKVYEAQCLADDFINAEWGFKG